MEALYINLNPNAESISSLKYTHEQVLQGQKLGLGGVKRDSSISIMWLGAMPKRWL